MTSAAGQITSRPTLLTFISLIFSHSQIQSHTRSHTVADPHAHCRTTPQAVNECQTMEQSTCSENKEIREDGDSFWEQQLRAAMGVYLLVPHL